MLRPNAPELAAGSMVSISRALLNEAYHSVSASPTTVGSAGAQCTGRVESIGRQNNCFVLRYKDINLISCVHESKL